MNVFINALIKETNWKRLAISLLLAVVAAMVLSTIIAEIKNKVFIYWFNNILEKRSEVTDYQGLAKSFIYSNYWFPVHILYCFIIQFVSCRYLIAKTPKKELTHAFLLGMASVVFVYQMDPILSLCSILFSLMIASRYKKKKTVILNIHKMQ